MVVGADAVCETEAPAFFEGRKPNALTGAEVSLSFPPKLAVTFPVMEEAPDCAAPDSVWPVRLPRGLDPVAPVTRFAVTFPLTGLFAVAGSIWFAPASAVPVPATPLGTAANAAPRHPRGCNIPIRHKSRTNTLRFTIFSDMIFFVSSKCKVCQRGSASNAWRLSRKPGFPPRLITQNQAPCRFAFIPESHWHSSESRETNFVPPARRRAQDHEVAASVKTALIAVGQTNSMVFKVSAL